MTTLNVNFLTHTAPQSAALEKIAQEVEKANAYLQRACTQLVEAAERKAFIHEIIRLQTEINIAHGKLETHGRIFQRLGVEPTNQPEWACQTNTKYPLKGEKHD